jgi:excisionase family DNA binding protein
VTSVVTNQNDCMFAADLISVPQAARRIGIQPDTLYRLARSGQFPPAIAIGGRWKVSVPRLEHYLHGEAAGGES